MVLDKLHENFCVSVYITTKPHVLHRAGTCTHIQVVDWRFTIARVASELLIVRLVKIAIGKRIGDGIAYGQRDIDEYIGDRKASQWRDWQSTCKLVAISSVIRNRIGDRKAIQKQYWKANW